MFLCVYVVNGQEVGSERSLTVVHEAVGWPGAAEYRAAMEMLVTSAMYVEEQLADAMSGSPPPTFSELVE